MLREVHTPLIPETWRSQLSEHPHRDYCQYILDGLDSISISTTPIAAARQLSAICYRPYRILVLWSSICGKSVSCPATTLSFLGILVDTVAMELHLPEEKLVRLKATIAQWRQKKSCTKRELLSLIEQLQQACKVVRYGRSFLRRMITLSTVAKELHHHIRLNLSFRSDLQWWVIFLPQWNSMSMMTAHRRASPGATIVSDASGNWGCGAYCSQGEWFQFQWPESWTPIHITIKELLPIIMSCALWGSKWKGMTVRCLCDNDAVVAILNSGKSKDNRAMHLVRCLTFFLSH